MRTAWKSTSRKWISLTCIYSNTAHYLKLFLKDCILIVFRESLEKLHFQQKLNKHLPVLIYFWSNQCSGSLLHIKLGICNFAVCFSLVLFHPSREKCGRLELTKYKKVMSIYATHLSVLLLNCVLFHVSNSQSDLRNAMSSEWNSYHLFVWHCIDIT